MTSATTNSKPLTSNVRKTTSPPQAHKEAAKIANRKKRNPSPYETKIDFSPEEKTVLEIKRTNKTQKLMWTPDLHCIFLTALRQLGIDAVPKQLHLRMNVAGITRENVASHLQKFRQRLRKMKNPISIPQYIQQELDKVTAILRRKQELMAANSHSVSIAQRTNNPLASDSSSPSSHDDEFDSIIQDLYNSSSDDDSFHSSQLFDETSYDTSSPEFEVAQQESNCTAQATYTLPPGVYPAQTAQFAAYAVPRTQFYPGQPSQFNFAYEQQWDPSFSLPATYQNDFYSDSPSYYAPSSTPCPYHAPQAHAQQLYFRL